MTDKEQIIKNIFKKANKDLSLLKFESNDSLNDLLIYKCIFSHDFAEAFWGNDEVDERGRTLIKAWEEEYRDSGLFMDFDEFAGEPEIYYQVAWQYHLQKMVLCEEPLKYLERFLKD